MVSTYAFWSEANLQRVEVWKLRHCGEGVLEDLHVFAVFAVSGVSHPMIIDV
jgi:hypothetical protein